ncbi:MAG: 6-bladed beta-propeller [Candidatus Aminicenantes bacterium]|nr:6-bladed beta-propeller [Candidatus Aminicenantes bacterium]
MKKYAILLFLIFALSIVSAQQIIENPKKPLNKDAGRIVQLEEVLRIHDDGEELIFRFPYGLKIGPDNGIYFYDNWMLYKFDENGKFVFKIIEPGQGPGEANNRTNYFFFNNEIKVQAGSPPKIMRFDYSGKYLGEKRTEMTRSYQFLDSKNKKIYGLNDDSPKLEETGTGYFDLPFSIYEISEDFVQHIKKHSFPLVHYVYLSNAWWPRAKFIYTFKNNSVIYVVHTPEYKIIEFDLEQNKINKIIDREYKRIKYVYPKDRRKPGPIGTRPPDYEYHHDILQMHIHKDQLWVFTSTRDKVKGRLIDVYNMEGKYIDNFYIKFPDKITLEGFRFGNVVLRGEYMYSIDEHEDGFYSVAKYKLNEDLLQ